MARGAVLMTGPSPSPVAVVLLRNAPRACERGGSTTSWLSSVAVNCGSRPCAEHEYGAEPADYVSGARP